MKQLESTFREELPLEILEDIQGAVSIAYLKGIETSISRRDDIDYKEKRIYYNMIDKRISEIEDFKGTW